MSTVSTGSPIAGRDIPRFSIERVFNAWPLLWSTARLSRLLYAPATPHTGPRTG